MTTKQTEQRKRDHLAPFRKGGVAPQDATTWLEHVRLVHQALTEVDLDVDGLDLTTEFAGKTLRAPLFITGMTGGTAEAREINSGIARVAQDLGLGFGLGSQRAMLERPDLADTYRVRDVAPDILIAGNIGIVQAAAASPVAIRALLSQVGADALCIHLNPAQELLQPEGDRRFAGTVEALGRLVETLDVPIIVKETGAGISREAAARLAALGVCWCDVAGLGGTSWPGVELLRTGTEHDPQRAAFRDWGVPTAAALVELHDTPLTLLASGGIRTGLDLAKVLVLGARVGGMAAPVIQAWFDKGEAGVRGLLEDVIQGLRMAMVLTGSQTLTELRAAPRVLLGPLREWAVQRGGAD